jgi:hypothetical protein
MQFSDAVLSRAKPPFEWKLTLTPLWNHLYEDLSAHWKPQKLKGKKWVIVSPSAEGPNSCRLPVEMLRLSCDYLGMKFAGKILAKAYEKGEILKNQKALKKAFEFGMSL